MVLLICNVVSPSPYYLTGSVSKMFIIWLVCVCAQGGSESWFTESNVAIASLAFHPTAQLLLIATNNELHFWDWSRPEPFAVVKTGSETERVRWVFPSELVRSQRGSGGGRSGDLTLLLHRQVGEVRPAGTQPADGHRQSIQPAGEHCLLRVHVRACVCMYAFVLVLSCN